MERQDVSGFGVEAARPSAVRYELRSRGFFSEFNILAYAFADALASGAELFVDERRSSIPWRKLFASFPPPIEELDAPAAGVVADLYPKAPDGAWNAMRRRVRDACLDRRVVVAPDVGFEGPFDELVFLAADRLFDPRGDIRGQADEARRALGLESAPFSAVQIRRGDKTEGYLNGKGKRVVETIAHPFEDYAACLEALAPSAPDVFVLTDDYRAVDEARAAHPQYRFHTLCTPEERGYFHADHLARTAEEQLADLRRLIVTVMLARDSAAFVGTFWSNLSTAVCMLHRNRSRCVSIDPAQAWPPTDPLFLPGRDTL